MLLLFTLTLNDEKFELFGKDILVPACIIVKPVNKLRPLFTNEFLKFVAVLAIFCKLFIFAIID